MTPLILDKAHHAGASIVYINRGFVPTEKKDPETRSQGQTAGRVSVVGLTRSAHIPDRFTPAPDHDKNIWYHRNPHELAMLHGFDVAQVAPFYIDAGAGAPAALPQGGETRIYFPNNHLGYAITWFGLAGSLMLVYGAWAWKHRKRGKLRKAPQDVT